MDGSHYQIVAATLAGDRPIDERTHNSLAILTERLESIKSHGGLFAGVEFSPHARSLKHSCEPLPVG